MNSQFFVFCFFVFYVVFSYILCGVFFSESGVESISEYLIFLPSFSNIVEYGVNGNFSAAVYFFSVISIPFFSLVFLWVERKNCFFPFDSRDSALAFGRRKMILVGVMSILFSVFLIIFVPSSSALNSYNPMVLPWFQRLLFFDDYFYFIFGVVFFAYWSVALMALGSSLIRAAFIK